MAARNKGAKGADLPCGLPSGKPVKAVAKNSFLYKANVLKVNNVAGLGKFVTAHKLFCNGGSEIKLGRVNVASHHPKNRRQEGQRPHDASSRFEGVAKLFALMRIAQTHPAAIWQIGIQSKVRLNLGS
jgi:hypothetical protein